MEIKMLLIVIFVAMFVAAFIVFDRVYNRFVAEPEKRKAMRLVALKRLYGFAYGYNVWA